MDEVGLMVMYIENGFLRFAPVGDVHPGVLVSKEC